MGNFFVEGALPLYPAAAQHVGALLCIASRPMGLHCLSSKFYFIRCMQSTAGQRMRGAPWLHLSSLGIGTYMGDADDDTDAQARGCTYLHNTNSFGVAKALGLARVLLNAILCMSRWLQP